MKPQPMSCCEQVEKKYVNFLKTLPFALQLSAEQNSKLRRAMDNLK